MNLLVQLWNFLDGKKTFVVGVLSIVLGVLQGDNQLVLQGLGFIGLRLAI